MDELSKSREIIDSVDKQMAKLFEERFKAVRDAAEFKAASGMPIQDSDREADVINRNSAYVEDPDIRTFYVNYMRQTMELSRRYMSNITSGMKIA